MLKTLLTNTSVQSGSEARPIPTFILVFLGSLWVNLWPWLSHRCCSGRATSSARSVIHLAETKLLRLHSCGSSTHRCKAGWNAFQAKTYGCVTLKKKVCFTLAHALLLTKSQLLKAFEGCKNSCLEVFKRSQAGPQAAPPGGIDELFPKQLHWIATTLKPRKVSKFSFQTPWFRGPHMSWFLLCFRCWRLRQFLDIYRLSVQLKALIDWRHLRTAKASDGC